MKGLIAEVFRSSRLGDATLGGVSSNHDSLTIVGEGIAEIFEVTEERPAVKIEKYCGRLRAVPVGKEGWPMFGGNFIYTSDGRFPSQYPIPVHDRFETAEQSEYLSR